MKIEIPSFPNNTPIPEKYAFGAKDPNEHVKLSNNVNPCIQWSDLPEDTQSLAVICVDPDVPSRGDDVNQEGKRVDADLPRTDFYHWVLVNIDPTLNEIPEGADSDSVVHGGKTPGKTKLGLRGINDYTGWMASNPDMKGYYGGYDGPCPPWNDERLHHYHFRVYALDVPSLDLPDNFTAADALAAMEGHVIEKNEWIGTYTLNPSLS